MLRNRRGPRTARIVEMEEHMDNPLLKSVYLIMLAWSVVAGLSACNTMEGAGEDIQRGGKAIEDEARERK